MTTLTADAFRALKPAEKTRYLSTIKETFTDALEQGKRAGGRSGMTQGSAALWVSLYGKDPVTRAFIAFLKKTGARVIDNYRGSRKAWYFGIQTDVGVYDGLVAATKHLRDTYGIDCGVSDAWD